jgi:hypothetical protein
MFRSRELHNIRAIEAKERERGNAISWALHNFDDVEQKRIQISGQAPFQPRRVSRNSLAARYLKLYIVKALLTGLFLFSYLSNFSLDLLGVFVDWGPAGEITHVAHGGAADGLHRFDCLINAWNQNRPQIEIIIRQEKNKYTFFVIVFCAKQPQATNYTI